MDAFIYQYLVGGLVFAIGLVYGFRQQYFGSQGPGLRNLIVVLVGLFFFAGIQSYLQYAPMDEQARYVVTDDNGLPKAKDFARQGENRTPRACARRATRSTGLIRTRWRPRARCWATRA